MTLREITRDNWKAALRLKVHPAQDKYVPTVTESVAEAWIRPHPGEQVMPYGLYAGKPMVGFFAYSYDPDSSDNYWINGLLIDRRRQGKGYGRAALTAILAHAAQVFPRCRQIGLTVHPQNTPARHLYESFCFRSTGEKYEGEFIMMRDMTGEEQVDASLLRKIRGGNPRSLGRVAEVVSDVLSDSLLFGVLIRGMAHDDPLVRMRTADAAVKIADKRPELLAPYTQPILTDLAKSRQPEVRWHIAQIIPKLPLDAVTQRRAIRILDRYRREESRLLRTFALQALVDLADADPHLRAKAAAQVTQALRDPSPAVRARARKLKRYLSQQGERRT